MYGNAISFRSHAFAPSSGHFLPVDRIYARYGAEDVEAEDSDDDGNDEGLNIHHMPSQPIRCGGATAAAASHYEWEIF